MKSRKIGAINYRSRSAYARVLLKNSKMTLTEIAIKVGMTPQTVFAVKKRMEQK